MRAVIFEAYGPPGVLTTTDLPTPEPHGDQVLVRVHATTVTSAECGMRRGEPLWGRTIIGLRRPRRSIRVLGLEFAGEVAAVGPAATKFRVGERVFGFTGFGVGANAEFKCISERASLAAMPPKVDFRTAAAAVDGFTTAWHFLDRVKRGQRVLVIGASGSVGGYAVQLASFRGATVHGVCSGRNAALVKELGAGRVFDYTTEDFTRSGERYDAVFDTVGRSSYAAAARVLTRRGVYIATTGLRNALLSAVTRRVRTGMSVQKHQALAELSALLDQGRIRVVIDRVYPLTEIAEAHRYVEDGHKTGNVVIDVSGTA